MKHFKRHHYHLIILAAIMGLGVITFFSLSGNRSLQLLVGIVTTVAYVIWGLMHHAIEGDLYKKVMVEYLLVGAIAIIVLLTIVGY